MTVLAGRRDRTRRALVAGLFAIAMLGIEVPTASAAPPHPVVAGPLATCPWLNPLNSIQYRVNELVAAMTLTQEVSLMQPVAGKPYPGYEHYVPGIPSLCVPAVMQQDGPAGVASGATGVTQLPAPITAAATFDSGVLQQYGTVIGGEMRGKGIGFALAPTLNLDRVPQWGRSFETLGEDPYLTTQLGDAEIEGIQNQGVIAEVKHYAEYNQETNRQPSLHEDNVVVSPRAMQETELSVFGSAVRDARAGAVMCAMPSVNGTGACENSYLMGVLRNQYGFDGDVRSDNPPSVTSDAAAANVGLDQAVSPAFSAAALISDVNDGQISRATIDVAAARILYPLFQVGLFDNPPTGSLSASVPTPADAAFAESTATAGTVLLRNNGGVLPLNSSSLSSIAVIGADAGDYAVTSGGGGSQVIASGVVTPLSAITARAGPGVKVTYSMGSGPYDALPDIPSADFATGQGRTSPPVPATTSTWSVKSSGDLLPPVTGSYQFSLTCDRPCRLYLAGQQVIDDSGPTGAVTPRTVTGSATLTAGQPEPIEVTYRQSSAGGSSPTLGTVTELGWLPPGQEPPSVAAAAAAARSAQVAIVFAGTFESEGFDQPNLNLSGVDDQLIEAVALANPRTIVVLNTGGPVLMPWLNNVAGVLEAWYPGQEDGASIASVLFGDADPGGKLPVTFPASASQPLSADSAMFPGKNGNVAYSEGLDIGYKWYDANGLTPLFPFGFGLSYTTFGFTGLAASPGNGPLDPVDDPNQVVIVVRAQVRNTGSRTGTEVAQLYLGYPGSAGEPVRQLRGFQRVELAPGQSTEVSFPLTAQDLAYWDTAANNWSVATGDYQVWVGDSSDLSGLPLSGLLRVP